jgi:predicted AlkP superfamily phosphohydrolase/phosphomutase
VHEEGAHILDYALDRSWRSQDGGLLFFYFSGTRPVQPHDVAPLRRRAPDSTTRSSLGGLVGVVARRGSTWKDVIYDIYLRMDPVSAGAERMPSDALLVVMSDHGFETYRRKFSLNTWLVEQGYLVLKPGKAKELRAATPTFSQGVVSTDSGASIWGRTRAYGSDSTAST